jgi:histidinol-phosphate aminotransferase
MIISRRSFLKTSTAVAVPIFMGLDIDYCEAATEPLPIDFTMGFPKGTVRLNRNENPLGPSPQAIEAAKAGIPGAARYADSVLPRKLLAENHGLDQDWILVGTGSGELLKLAPLVYARDGNVVATLESYRSPTMYAEKLGAKIKWVNLLTDQGYRYDVDGLLAAVDGETRMLILVTPNNPTGTAFSFEQLRKIADGLPKDVLLLIDEAYVHFQPDGKTAIDLLHEGYTNLLVTRTFSKAHGLAGLRIGYGLGHPDIMNQIARFGCGPTSTNMAGFGAAVASLQDSAHVQRSRTYAQDCRAFYERNFQRLGLNSLAGAPPFIMVELGERANTVWEELRNRNVFVRKGEEWAMPNHLRISYGLENENQAFFSALEKLI